MARVHSHRFGRVVAWTPNARGLAILRLILAVWTGQTGRVTEYAEAVLSVVAEHAAEVFDLMIPEFARFLARSSMTTHRESCCGEEHQFAAAAAEPTHI